MQAIGTIKEKEMLQTKLMASEYIFPLPNKKKKSVLAKFGLTKHRARCAQLERRISQLQEELRVEKERIAEFRSMRHAPVNTPPPKV